jgi:hypothetical protein
MARRLGVVVFVIALTATVGAAIAATNGGSTERTGDAAAKKPLPFEEHNLYIETNDTDKDAGLQLFLDGEDWRHFKLLDTNGDTMVDLNTRGKVRRVGLTELFFEASEPSFDELPFSKFKKRFPEGKYRFRGETVEGRKMVGADRLSHLIPDGPNLTFPTKDSALDPDGFVVAWDPVMKPRGVDIVTYQVIVEQGKREFSMYLPGDATSGTIPGEFLEPDTKTAGEVLARDKSGNQTITQFPAGLRTGG